MSDPVPLDPQLAGIVQSAGIGPCFWCKNKLRRHDGAEFEPHECHALAALAGFVFFWLPGVSHVL